MKESQKRIMALLSKWFIENDNWSQSVPEILLGIELHCGGTPKRNKQVLLDWINQNKSHVYLHRTSLQLVHGYYDERAWKKWHIEVDGFFISHVQSWKP